MKDHSPFSGIKVLAVTQAVAAPFAAYQLALHGADVIIIENPNSADVARRTGNIRSQHLIKHNMGPGFLAHGANKKSITLNLKNPDGQKIFRQLAATADVIIENMRTGDMARYGLGYADINELNPRIIYGSLTGYGQTGPKKRDKAIDPVIEAASGMMSVTGTPESGPVKVGAPVVDYCAGFALALGIVTALFHREQTGKGQHIDVSLLESALVMMSNVFTEAVSTGVAPSRVGNRSFFGNVVTDTFPCKEGTLLISANHKKNQQNLWNAINRLDIPEDPRFSSPDACRQNVEALYTEIGATLKTQTADEWEEILNNKGVMAMKVRSFLEIVDYPQIKSRELLHRFDDIADLGVSATVAKAPYKLSEAPARITSPPPVLGQHTDEILSGLGFNATDIEKLHSSGAV